MANIKLISFDLIDNKVYSIVISIDGIEFKRLQDKWGNYPPVWNDVNSHFGQIDLLSKQKEKELEAIFQALKPEIKALENA